MLRQLSTRALSLPSLISRRNVTLFPVSPWRRRPSALERQFDLLEREMDRVFRSPFWSAPFSSPISSLDFPHLPNLIVTENGQKKFKVEFDVSRFKPEEVRVKTNAAESLVEVEAKHEDDTCRYEFTRKITVPPGTTIPELQCRFTSDGTLTLEAPYVPPPEEKKEIPEETQIKIEHK